MTPQEVLAQISARGYHLAYRPGGLRITGSVPATDEVRSLIAGHREALMTLLEEEAKAWAAMEASLAAGRLTSFPEHLHYLVDPVLVQACMDDEARLAAGRRTAQPWKRKAA